MFFVDCRIDLILDNRFHNMEYRQSQGNPRKGSHPAGIAVDHSFGVEFRAVRVGCTQNDYNFAAAVLVCNFFNCFLTFQVKCSGSRSDKALCLGEDRFCPGTSDTGFDGRALYTVPFTDNNNLFSFQLHIYSFTISPAPNRWLFLALLSSNLLRLSCKPLCRP